MEEKQELERCAKDFVYFTENYLKINHFNKGEWELIPFKLYDYQKRLVQAYENNRFTISKCFRQGGFTTLVCAYMLWRAMFKLDECFLFVARTDYEAISASNIVHNLIQNLPNWLRPSFGKYNAHRMCFKDTGCQMIFCQFEESCGIALNWLIIDQAAFIDNIESHWKAIYPTLSYGGKCIIQSTPNKKNWFYKMYQGAVRDENTFKIADAEWKENPEFNNVDWVKDTILVMGGKGWMEQFETKFLD